MYRLKLLGTALALAVVAVALQAPGGQPGSPPTPIVLQGIDPNWFSDTGEEFLAPFPGEKATVTEEEVRAKVKEMFGDAPIRQLVLAHARVPSPARFPPLDQLVWLASMEMGDGEGPDPNAPTFLYSLHYFDAQTGESIYGMEAWLPKAQSPVATLAPGEADLRGVPALP